MGGLSQTLPMWLKDQVPLSSETLGEVESPGSLKMRSMRLTSCRFHKNTVCHAVEM